MPEISAELERGDRRASLPQRLDSIDALRGAAIVSMVVWHATDGWLAPDHRSGVGWHFCRVVGGLAAPAFLLVAGAAVALALARGRAPLDIARRGVGLIGLGFLLRLAQWLIDGGALLRIEGVALGTLGAMSLAVAWRRGRMPRREALSGPWIALQGGLAATYAIAVLLVADDSAPALLRFDVLHCIGASIAITALARRRLHTPVLALVAALVFAVAPTLAALFAGAPPLAWIAQAPGAAAAIWARFPLFPYAGWALLGAVASPLLRRPSLRGLASVGAIGAALAIVSFEGGLWITRRGLHLYPAARPHVHALFVWGALVALGVGVIAATRMSVVRAVLVPLGRHSLLIYALHLEFVYGLLSLPVHRALGPLGVASGSLLLLAAAAGLGVAVRRRSSRSASPVEGGSGP